LLFLNSLSFPARIYTKVVFPVPFSPRRTTISDEQKEPFSIVSSKSPNFFLRLGYSYPCYLSLSISSDLSVNLKDRAKSRKRIFSVFMKPERKMLIPSLTEKGMVTTP
jgi:hypothetical protein